MRILAVASVFVLLSSSAWAQTQLSGSIAGVVKDTSGAVTPGVTVEAASPALIEKVRSVVSDDQGQYKIVSLAPGTYTVTFTLAGFGSVKGDGVELTTGFTATVSAELKVGAVEETVTVSGAAPVVDTQNVITQNVFSGTLLNLLPNARTIRGYAPLIPGATMSATSQDVGGNRGEANTSIGIHGNRGADMLYTINGLRPASMMNQGGGSRTYSVNAAASQEVTFETSGISAESESGGVQMNIVPKEGGNVVTGFLNVNYTNSDLQSTNTTDALLARGLVKPLKLRKIYDENPALGGPVRKDRLWFFVSQRAWDSESPSPTPGDYRNLTQGTPFYTPDLSKPFFRRNPRRSNATRFTWQATEKQKFNVGNGRQRNCNCPQIAANAAPESQGYHVYHDNFADGNFVPDCTLDASVPGANGECGPISDTKFGQPTANTTLGADAFTGFGNRGYNWQGSVSIQHELRPGLGVNVGYFRTWYGNFTVTDNLAVGPADYASYCVTAPVNAKLPGGGGNQICGLYDLSPTLFGQVSNLVTQASN